MAWICGQPPLLILSIGSVTIHRACAAELRAELLDRPREARVLQCAAFDLADGVQDGGVVSAIEGRGDRAQREIGELTRQVHGELARSGDFSRAAGGEDGVDAQLEAGGDGLLDLAGVRLSGGWRSDLVRRECSLNRVGCD